MKTRLVGRVWVDQVEDTTLFIFPAKKDWKIVFFGAWLAGWSFAGRLVVPAWRSLAHPATADWFNALWGVGWVCGIYFVSGAILWAAGGVDRLRLSFAEAQLTRSIFGIVFSRKVIPTAEVRNLRFTPSSRSGRKERESCISFEGNHGTVKFGTGLEDGEALAVIDRMLSVYSFPKKDRALKYLDLSS